MNTNKSLLASLIIGVAAITYLLLINPFIDTPASVYSTDKLDNYLLKGIRFKDVTDNWNVKYDHRANTSRSNSYLNSVHPSVLIYDFDNNGLMDIFYSGGVRNFLYLNRGEGRFEESSSKFNLTGNDKLDNLNSMAVMADFNNDGQDDLYMAGVPLHRLYLRNGATFVENSHLLDGYKSFPDGVNVADFNQDGLVDIVVGNFIELNDTMGRAWYLPRRYDEQTGGYNHLLIQKDDGYFLKADAIDFQTRSFTHAVGISDINSDGWPDIFFANDYSKDQMFENLDGNKVKDVTEEYIPRAWHGNSGMNAEFSDYNLDGFIDLYVTYIHKPPFYRAYNILWEKNKTGDGFTQISWDENVGRCGFSWGAKFADFNRDGQMDLFVVNGRDKDGRITKASEGKSFWYERTQLTSIPSTLLDYMQQFERNSDKKYYNSAFERDCLFIQNYGEFFDVADELNMTDAQEGRGLSLADLNNDGLMDIVVTNVAGTSKVYLNESQSQNHWIGFTIKNKRGSQLPIGAWIKLKQSRGPDLVKEYYPANGYRGQSDPRVVFTLDKNSAPEYLEVKFPGQKESVYYTEFKIDQYNEVKESSDE